LIGKNGANRQNYAELWETQFLIASYIYLYRIAALGSVGYNKYCWAKLFVWLVKRIGGYTESFALSTASDPIHDHVGDTSGHDDFTYSWSTSWARRFSILLLLWI